MRAYFRSARCCFCVGFIHGRDVGAYLGVSPWLSDSAWRDNGGGYRTCDWCLPVAVGWRVCRAVLPSPSLHDLHADYPESECYITTAAMVLRFGVARMGFLSFRLWLQAVVERQLVARQLLYSFVAFIVSLVSSIVVIHGRLGLAFRAMMR